MVEQGKIYSVEFNNFRRVHRNRQGGEVFAIELEVTEEEWHYLGDFPQDAIGEMAIRWTERTTAPKQEKTPKPKPQPTPYGQFWRILDGHGFHNRPDVRAWLNYDGANEATAKEILRSFLEVESRGKEASPELLLKTMRSSKQMLDGAITVVENARVKYQQHA